MTLSRGGLAVAAAFRPMYALDGCGDAVLAEETPGGVLVAAIDGGGHGVEARAAAAALGEAIRARARAGEPLERLLAGAHDATRGTERGAAVAIAVVGADRRIAWISIGSVVGALFRDGACVAELRRDGGSMGIHLPALDASALVALRGDVLLLATDGVDRQLLDATLPRGDAPALAAHVLQRFRKGGDDALVMVVVLV